MTTMDDFDREEMHRLSEILADPPVVTIERPDGWHRTELRGPFADFIEYFEGVPWDQRPVPHCWHWCRPVTRSCTRLQVVEHCACGAMRRRPEMLHWAGRNGRTR